jgi:hypothetical protein
MEERMEERKDDQHLQAVEKSFYITSSKGSPQKLGKTIQNNL